MNTLVLTPEQVIQKLNWRYATANFDPSKKIPDDVWHALEQSLVLALSCYRNVNPLCNNLGNPITHR